MHTQTQFVKKAFLDLNEAAQYTGMSRTTLRRAVRSNALAYHRLGISETRGKILIRVTDLEQFLGKCRVAATF